MTKDDAELKITDVHNGSGEPNNERVVIEVLKKTSLKDYAIIDNTFNQSGEKSDINRHFYRFPEQEVNVKDTVILYSGSEPNDSKIEDIKNFKEFERQRDLSVYPEKPETYKYYFESEGFIWNDTTGDTITLLKLSVISFKKIPPKAKRFA